MVGITQWRLVVFADDCDPCYCCGEPTCPVCDIHYADCDCPGPCEDDLYEYQETDCGLLLARRLQGPP